MDEKFTEEEKESILSIGEFQENSGLVVDFRNSWYRQDMAFLSFEMKNISERQLRKKLAKPVRIYEDYIREQNIVEIAELLLRLAKPEQLSKVNRLVEEYNALPLENKFGKVHSNYCSRCQEIIIEGRENSE